MLRGFRFYIILFLIALVSAGVVSAQDDDFGYGQLDAMAARAGNGAVTRVQGSITLQIVPGCGSPTGLCSEGVVTGDLEGTLFSNITSFVEGNNFNRATADTTITTADGTLIIQLTARIRVSDGSSATRLRIVDGTGIYDGARGLIISRGGIDPNTGLEIVDYRGVIVVR